jgi:hypothetical protein
VLKHATNHTQNRCASCKKNRIEMTREINLAFYREKDWLKFLKLIDDKENMHDTWSEWNKAYLKTKRDLTLQGFIVNDFVVNLTELKNYCASKGTKIDGKARAEFVSNQK